MRTSCRSSPHTTARMQDSTRWTNTAIDPGLGSWADVSDIAESHDVMVDMIVNHVSADSGSVNDVRANGEVSSWYAMFLTMSSVFPDGASEEDLTGISRPRPGPPFTPIRLGDRLRYV